MKTVGCPVGRDLAVLTYEQVAGRLHEIGVTRSVLSRQSIQRIESRAMQKLRRCDMLRELFLQLGKQQGGERVYAPGSRGYDG